MRVVAAAVVDAGRLLVVSKRAAPAVFYLPGGKPELGESPEETLRRELDEELGVVPRNPEVLAVVEDVAALERVPMRLTVYLAELAEEPVPAAELAALRWVDIHDPDGAGVRLSPAVRGQVLPLLKELGPSPASAP